MERFAMEKLERWRNDSERLPLIIRGARQVGKTWLMKEFGKTCFQKSAYINFDRNPRMQQLFSGDFDTERILRGLAIESGVEIEPEETLIILDEIQEAPSALQSLKYFAEDERHSYFILAAGSLLGIAMHEGTSFPVGKVDSIELSPLSFQEFLWATGNEALAGLIRDCDFQMAAAFRDKYVDLLKNYYYVGGMPAAVNAYVKDGNLKNVRRVQKRLLSDYEQDFSKHAPREVVPRIQMVWDGILSQLAKENKKFVYGVLREGARAKDFELAIQWLIDCGLCHKVGRVKKGAVPLKAYRDIPAFKLYFVDVGLLAAMADLDARTLLEGTDIFTEFKGALTEQYVCQQILAELDTEAYYWSADSSSGEVDFVLQHEGRIIPLEVKAQENLNAKSLKSFVSTYGLDFGVRMSMSDYRKQEKLINLPLYAVAVLWDAIMADATAG
ncbi:MAG: ATP-binding protein [Lachnospiraceae bacterium]|uniref:ATP-binding protein n=1 Tax=uncultured Acetatifactor sp. TaxID=1671927 RepID=UPI0026276982|nr:AAA family ATPase [uncultured Acetatifactor sp.]MCI8789251.1 ATP-binding protein [Lachnospiraceae bacterium]